MRVVADTNTVLSAFVFGGIPLEVIRLFDGQAIHQLIVTHALLDELEDVLYREKFASAFVKIGRTPAAVLKQYRQLTTLVPLHSFQKGSSAIQKMRR